MTREAIHVALLNLLYDALHTSNSGSFKVVDRQWIPAESETHTAKQPALHLVATPETVGRVAEQPPARVLTFDAVIHCHKGEQDKVISSTEINNLLEEVDNAIEPDPVTGRQTLGGLVSDVRCQGNVLRSDATITGQSVIIYPIVVPLKDDNEARGGQFFFDSGFLFAIPNDTTKNRTPQRIGALSNIRIESGATINPAETDLQYDTHPLYGKRQVTGIAQFAMINGRILSQIVYGQELVAGAIKCDRERAYTIPAAPGPYTQLVTPPSSGTYNLDLGVSYAETGVAFKLVAGTPAAGEYSITGATYTFAAADEDTDIKLSYLYTVGTGQKLTIANLYSGPAPSFKVVLNGVHNDKQVTAVLNNCVIERFALPTVLENFAVSQLEFQGFANPDTGGEVGTISTEDS